MSETIRGAIAGGCRSREACDPGSRRGYERTRVGHQPRSHDLRHTAAVTRLVRWYREGRVKRWVGGHRLRP